MEAAMIVRTARAGHIRARWSPCTWQPLHDPLEQIAAEIETHEQARFWLRFFEAVRDALTSSGPWPSIESLNLVRPGERQFLRSLRMVRANATLRVLTVQRLEASVVRLRLAWELDR
jgi:hypothetical protein